MKKINEEKAKILYDFLDESKLFKGTVVKKDRSIMNVPFITGNEELDALFVKESKAAGLENLKGHRTCLLYTSVGKESTQRGIYLRKGKCHCFQC